MFDVVQVGPGDGQGMLLGFVLTELLSAGPEAVREAKRLIRERPTGDETAQIAARLRAGDEGQEGLRAFLDRREPGWG